MNTYPLSSAGVADWLASHYASSTSVQLSERQWINSDFSDWLEARFELSESELDYLSALDSGFVIALRDQILYSLEYQQPIAFERADPAPNRRNGDSVKVTEYSRKSSASKADPAKIPPMHTDSGSSHTLLEIRIYYQEA